MMNKLRGTHPALLLIDKKSQEDLKCSANQTGQDERPTITGTVLSAIMAHLCSLSGGVAVICTGMVNEHTVLRKQREYRDID